MWNRKWKKSFQTKDKRDWKNIYLDVRNLSDLSIDKDYYKLITNVSAFNGNYIEYETKGDKDKTSSIKEYLDMISSDINEVIRPVLNLFFYDKISKKH